MPLKISKEGSKASLFTINPWLFLLSKIFSISLKIHSKDWLIIFVIIISGSISLISTNSLSVIPQIFGLVIFSSVVSKYNTNESSTLVWIFRIYLIIGTIISLFNYIIGDGRIGLFGSEVNFTGYTAIILFTIIHKLDKFRFYDIIVLLILIIITGSRAFFIMSIIAYFLFKIRKKRNIILVITIGSYLIYFSAQYILAFPNELPFLQKTGYINDFSRLYQLNDSSTNERLRIIELYLSTFNNHPLNFLFGFNSNAISNITMEPHNSLIQKIYDYGVIHTIILLVLAYKKLPRHIFSIITLYGLFLHNLFSLPLLILMKLYTNEEKN